MDEEKKRIIVLPYKKILIALFAFFLLIVFLSSFQYLSSIYIPVLVSYFLAFLLNPIVEFAEKRGFGRVGPIMTLLCLFFLAITSATLLMIPKLMVQLNTLFHDIPNLIDKLTSWLVPYSIQLLGYDMFTDWKKFVHDMLPQMRGLPADKIVGNLFSNTARAVGTLVSVLLVPLLTFYMLKEYNSINERILNFVPRRHVPAFQEITRRLSQVLGSLIRGQFLVCAILAMLYSISLSAIGLELSMIIGTIAGILNLIPFMGPMIAMVFASLFALVSGLGLASSVGVLGVFILANLIDNTILTPKIVGKQMGINSIMVILILLAGGELLGFLGMLLALPITAMVKVLGGYFIEQYFASPYYKNLHPKSEG